MPQTLRISCDNCDKLVNDEVDYHEEDPPSIECYLDKCPHCENFYCDACMIRCVATRCPISVCIQCSEDNMCPECYNESKEEKSAVVNFKCRHCGKERKNIPLKSDKPCGDPREADCELCDAVVWFCDFDSCLGPYQDHREYVVCEKCEVQCDKCKQGFHSKDLAITKCRLCKHALALCEDCDERDVKCAACSDQPKPKRSRSH